MEAQEAIKQGLESLVKSRQTWLEQAFKAQHKINQHSKNIGAVVRLLGDKASVSISSEKVNIRLRITSMEEAKPVIESLQDILGCDFDGTSDYAETGYGVRTFTCALFPIELCAVIEDNPNATCRSVQVGEQIVPVWELRCDEGAAK
jgi:hypothetical protein